jgi:hypothetical protein
MFIRNIDDVVSYIHAHKLENAHAAIEAIQQVEVWSDGLVSFEQFHANANLHSVLIQPSLDVQRLFREAIG